MPRAAPRRPTAARPRTVPRKRPRQERSRATTDALLTATARLLVKVGFDRASTNRIAAEAGVSVGTLYQYFPSKEALVAAVIERHMDEMLAVLEGSMERLAGASMETVVRELVGVMVRAHAVDPMLHRVLVEQIPRVGRMDRVHDVERRFLAVAKLWLEAHAHEVRPKDLELAAFIAMTAVEAITHAAVIHHPERTASRAEELIEETTELVVRYLRR